MGRDFIDRRPRASAGATTVALDAEDAPGRYQREDAWGRAWPETYGEGSPLSDHERALIAIDQAVERYGWELLASSTRVRRWKTSKGEPRESVRVKPSRRTSDGHQPNGARNLRIYLLSAVLGMTDAEIAALAEIGLEKPDSVRAARLRGEKLALFARSKTDPRRPCSPETRPHGRNEARW